MKFSIVTPSYNQSAFIERTINSVADQHVSESFEVEHIVVDGGSTDDTVEILRRHGQHISWKSEPDRGQSHAINKGLQEASGDILGWLNADDTYAPGALEAVARASEKQSFDWCFGNAGIIDENDNEIRRVITWYKRRQARKYSYSRLLRRDFISQPAVFFSREAYERTGLIDETLVYSMDYDYWLRLAKHCEPRYIDQRLANFRWHSASKNGAMYRKAAWETLQTAKRHAPSKARFDIFMHYLHYHTLKTVYRFM